MRVPCVMWYATVAACAVLHSECRIVLAQESIDSLRASPNSLSRLKEVKAAIAKAPSAEEKCFLAVVYSLGCLANNDIAEGLAMRANVITRFPGQRITALLTDEVLFEPCNECRSGVARVVRFKCPSCGGTGLCTSCRGSGRYVGRYTQSVCPACSGGKCATCKGHGAVNRPEKCQVCGGSGRMIAVRTCSDVYMLLLEENRNIATLPTSVDGLKNLIEKNKESKRLALLEESRRRAEEERRLAEVKRREEEERRLAEVKRRQEERRQAEGKRLEEEFRRSIKERVPNVGDSSDWLTKYGITYDDLAGRNDHTRTQIQRNLLHAELWNRALVLSHKTDSRALFLPLPNGLRYKVQDVAIHNNRIMAVIHLTRDETQGDQFRNASHTVDRNDAVEWRKELRRSEEADVNRMSVKLGVPFGDPIVERINKGDSLTSDNWIICYVISRSGQMRIDTVVRSFIELQFIWQGVANQ